MRSKFVKARCALNKLSLTETCITSFNLAHSLPLLGGATCHVFLFADFYSGLVYRPAGGVPGLFQCQAKQAGHCCHWRCIWSLPDPPHVHHPVWQGTDALGVTHVRLQCLGHGTHGSYIILDCICCPEGHTRCELCPLRDDDIKKDLQHVVCFPQRGQYL